MTNDEAPAALVTAAELTRVLPISKEQIWRAVASHKLPCYRLGRRQFFSVPEVLAALHVPVNQAAGNGSGGGEE